MKPTLGICRCIAKQKHRWKIEAWRSEHT